MNVVQVARTSGSWRTLLDVTESASVIGRQQSGSGRVHPGQAGAHRWENIVGGRQSVFWTRQLAGEQRRRVSFGMGVNECRLGAVAAELMSVILGRIGTLTQYREAGCTCLTSGISVLRLCTVRPRATAASPHLSLTSTSDAKETLRTK
jgi:hypothetical protein